MVTNRTIEFVILMLVHNYCKNNCPSWALAFLMKAKNKQTDHLEILSYQSSEKENKSVLVCVQDCFSLVTYPLFINFEVLHKREVSLNCAAIAIFIKTNSL